MPIEKKSGESQQDWMGRCVSHYVGKGDAQDQAVAKCISMWDTMSRNEYFKDVISRLRALKKKKKC